MKHNQILKVGHFAQKYLLSNMLLWWCESALVSIELTKRYQCWKLNTDFRATYAPICLFQGRPCKFQQDYARRILHLQQHLKQKRSQYLRLSVLLIDGSLPQTSFSLLSECMVFVLLYSLCIVKEMGILSQWDWDFETSHPSVIDWFKLTLIRVYIPYKWIQNLGASIICQHFQDF